jgi:bifunctional non-homologous end joining protein LigD
VDGEITDSRFHLWDLLDINGTDLRIQPYEIRYARLGLAFRGVDEALRVCDTAMTPKAKRAFLKAMHESGAEGFVCKNRNAAYAGGRAGQHFKCKFVTTSSFIVGPKPAAKAADGHRSIGLYLLEENHQRFMGTVGVPERCALPREGQIVEIRYLYCHPGADGKLIQAKYFGKVREDVARADCSVNQLKIKADESDPTES